MALGVGENPYSLSEILVVSYNKVTDTYSDTIVSLDPDQIFDVDPQHDTDQQRNSGAVSAGLSVKTHSVVTVGFGGIPLSALAIMIGLTISDSGSGETLIRDITKLNAGNIMPYFGAIGVSPSEGGGVFVNALRAVMLDKEPQVKFDGTGNKFIMNEAPGIAFSISGVVDKWKIYATPTLWESNKPSDGTEFKAFFS